LSLEVFLNSGEINTLIGSFLGGLPPVFITPIAFVAIGILIMLYTLLTTIAKGRRSKKDWDD
jgi:hypothetical protein